MIITVFCICLLNTLTHVSLLDFILTFTCEGCCSFSRIIFILHYWIFMTILTIFFFTNAIQLLKKHKTKKTLMFILFSVSFGLVLWVCYNFAGDFFTCINESDIKCTFWWFKGNLRMIWLLMIEIRWTELNLRNIIVKMDLLNNINRKYIRYHLILFNVQEQISL